jgi:hypothetical protein
VEKVGTARVLAAVDDLKLAWGSDDQSNDCEWSFWPIRARCADVVAIHYIAAKTSPGSARLGIFTLLLCNHPHPLRRPRSIYRDLHTLFLPAEVLPTPPKPEKLISCSNGIGVAVVSNGGSYTALFIETACPEAVGDKPQSLNPEWTTVATATALCRRVEAGAPT